MKKILFVLTILLASFAGAQTVNVIQPNGGEVLYACQTYTVKWNQTGSPSNYWNVDYSLDGGIIWTSVASNYLSTNGQFVWTVPNVSSTTVLMRVKDALNAVTVDQSDAVFSINIPITVTSPNGGEAWTSGTVQNITWSSIAISNLYTIRYSINNGSTWTTIVSSYSTTTNTYAWTVPFTPTTTCLIQVYDATASCTKDQSDATFTITPPTPQLLTPNGGESIAPNCNYNITWNTSTFFSTVNLYYSLNNGTTWTTIATNQTNNGVYAWTPPVVAMGATTCLIKAANYADVTIYDISNANFTINKPTTITSPNGGENWLGCSTYTISWTKGSTCLGNWNIYYSLDNGVTWVLFSAIGDNGALSQGYAWTLPEAVYSSTMALIKVAPSSYTTALDVSDATFTMTPSDDITVLYPNGGEMLTGGTTAVITWSATAATSGTYTIRYFDGSTNSTLTTTVTGTSYTWTVPNVTPTKTNCTITVRDTYNSCKTDVSNNTFTVNYVPPVAQLITPNGGESLYSGTNYNITWNTASFFSTINLYYSLNNGTTWTTIATNVTNSGAYAWTLPVGTSSLCLVKAANYADVNVYDVSDAVFTIKPPVTVLTPNGDNGVTIWGGCTVTSITFDHSPAWSNYKLEYSINNGASWNTIVASYAVTANPATYNWNIPNNATSQALVRVSPVSVAYTDQSNTGFTITKPVTIIQPNFGGVMQSGTVYPIKWTSDGISNLYDIFYSTNGGTSYTNIVMGYNTSINTYSWTVPATVSNNCKVIVRDNINTCKNDTSDQAFIIQSTPPAITLLNPNGGDTLRGCSTYTINWTDGVSNGSYNLAYSTNSGSSWNTIVSNYTTTADNYSWVIPNTVNSNNVLLRVQSATTLTTLDLSDALLSIKNGTLITTPTTTAICSGTSVQLNASGGINYAWTPSGSLTSASISNPIASPTSSTIYTVQSVNGSCVLSNTVNITVSSGGALANVTITASPSNTVCPGSTVTFSANPINGGVNPSYQWIVNGAGVGASTSTYSSNTLSHNDVVQCLMTSDLPCVSNNPALSNPITMDMSSGQTPSVTISALPSNTICPGTLITFSASPMYGGTAPTYVWKLNGSTVGTSAATYTNNTLTNGSTITVIMTSNAGCVTTSTASSLPMAITVNTTPAVPASINGSTVVCANSVYTYTAALVSGATTYNWTLPGGWTGSSTSNTIAITTATNGGVIMVQASNACGTSSSRILSVSVGSPTISIAGSSSVCVGSVATLTASGATSYTWSTSQNGSSISVTPTINTTYSVTGSDAGGCTNTAVKSITVNALPVLGITSPTICGGSTATVTASGASTYTWNTSATGSNLVVTPASTTNYTVTGTSTLGCTNTATTSVTVGPAPSISVNSATICTGTSAVLTASGVSTYTWSTSATGSSIVVTPTATTVYTVSGNVPGCTTVATKTTAVSVNALPAINITASSNAICVGQSSGLSVGGTVTSYTWNTSQTTASISVSPTVTTTYSITGTNSNGCQNTAVKTITVNALPLIGVTSPSVCGGSSATIVASGASTYTWNTSVTSASLVVSPSSNTSYTVTGTTVFGCSNTATTTVTVGPAPSISVNTATVCSGSPAVLTASGVTTYTWSTTQTTASVTVTPMTATIYTVSGMMTGCNTIATNTTMVSVNALPTLSLNVTNPEFCIGLSTDITASGSAMTYTWNTGETTAAVTVTPNASSVYTVTGEDANGCRNTTQAPITVNPLPVINVMSQTICVGGTATLSASGASTYTWNTGANTQNLVVSPTVGTDYTVTGTSVFGCVNTATATIALTTAPLLSVNSEVICSGSSVLLTATGVSTYTWNTGQTTSTINVSPTSSTAYTVSGQAVGCSATVSQTATVTVNASPTVVAVSSNTLLCVGQTATLSASGADTYTWSTAQTGSDIVVSPTSTSDFTVTGEASNGCLNTIVVTQNVSLCTGVSTIKKQQIEVNVFPNPFNNKLTIITVGSKQYVHIFNATGAEVYTAVVENETTEIDLHNEAPGIYFIKIGSVTKKVIKE